MREAPGDQGDAAAEMYMMDAPIDHRTDPLERQEPGVPREKPAL